MSSASRPVIQIPPWATRTPEYDVAVDLLRDLHELAWREGEPDTFDKRRRDLRQRYANRLALLQRLNHAGLPAATGRS